MRSFYLALLLTCPAGTVATAADRPNILWLIAEDFGPDLGCYGTKQVWTPNLDKLAADGVRYTRCLHHRPGLLGRAARRS